jgi:hypothetical protein
VTDRAGNTCTKCGRKTRFNQYPWAHEERDTIVLVLHNADGGAAHPAYPKYDTQEYIKNLEKAPKKVLHNRR